MGFGPSNLAVAVAARELAPRMRCCFLERNAEFAWHPGMMLPGSRLQISFLKDLVTMRNTSSRYTFLSYLSEIGRLEHFINLREFCPSRQEYSGYLKWVAGDFADQVRFAAEVVRVTPHADLFEVTYRDTEDAPPATVLARNLVVAPGGRPPGPGGRRCERDDSLQRVPTSLRWALGSRRWPGTGGAGGRWTERG
jgi:lysine/ornithine N-monooxygenase